MTEITSGERPFKTYLRRLTTGRIHAGRDFRLLWLGQSVSILGDQFYLVALPWLVLSLTGSGLKLGTILFTATLTKVSFQLVGGAIGDMVSQRKTMIASSAVRALVCAVLTALVLAKQTQLWHLFVIVAVFGMSDAFFSPAFKAFIPTVVKKEDLVVGNSRLLGSALLATFIGPSLGGLVISVAGTGAAFGLDTLSFIFVILCLLLMRSKAPTVLQADDPSERTTGRGRQLLTSIGQGLRYSLSEPTIRALVVITGLVEFSFAGPFTIGLASLANKFAGGATAFGAMLSALGGGLLIGTLIVGSMHSKYSFGKTILLLSTALGVGLTLLGFVPNVAWACGLMVLIGVCGGYSQVLIATWLQTKSDPHMRGRVMSVVVLTSFGLTPLSYVLTGALTSIGVSFMFIVIGISLVLAIALSAIGPSGRALIQSGEFS